MPISTDDGGTSSSSHHTDETGERQGSLPDSKAHNDPQLILTENSGLLSFPQDLDVDIEAQEPTKKQSNSDISTIRIKSRSISKNSVVNDENPIDNIPTDVAPVRPPPVLVSPDSEEEDVEFSKVVPISHTGEDTEYSEKEKSSYDATLTPKKSLTNSPLIPSLVKPKGNVAEPVIDSSIKVNQSHHNPLIAKQFSKRSLRRIPSVAQSLKSQDHHYAPSETDSTYSEIALSFSRKFLFNINMSENVLGSGITKEYWLENSSAKKCCLCEKRFTTFRRKHHCRICGKIFCSGCTIFISGEKFHINARIRVCQLCVNVADRLENDISTDDDSIPEESLRPIRTRTRTNSTHKHDIDQSPRVSLEGEPPQPPPMMAIPATRTGEAVEIPTSRRLDSRSRRNTNEHNASFSTDDRNKPKSNFSFNFNFNFNSQNNPESSDKRQLELEDDQSNISDLLGTFHRSHIFGNSDSENENERSMSLYTALNSDKGIQGSYKYDLNSEKNLRTPIKMETTPAERRVQRVEGSMDNDLASLPDSRITDAKNYNSLNRVKNRMRPKKSRMNQRTRFRNTENPGESDLSLVPNTDSIFNFGLGDDPDSKSSGSRLFSIVNKNFNLICEAHGRKLLQQILRVNSVSNTELWEKKMLEILQSIDGINLDISNGYDLHRNFKVKRIYGAKVEDSQLLNGVVFSKILPLKSMSRKISFPKICLIMFPVAYASEGFTSLEPMIAQEEEYTRKLVDRIIAMNPDIVLIGASISGLALKMLDDASITVASDIKPQIIERLSKMTNADIVSSIDKLALKPRLGMCGLFEERTYLHDSIVKNYFYFTECESNTGCTILINDDPNVKASLTSLIYVFFNLNLEKKVLEHQFLQTYNSQDSEYSDSDSIRYNTSLIGNEAYEFLPPSYESFLNKYRETIFSSSPGVIRPLPSLLINVRKLLKQLSKLSKLFVDFENECSSKGSSKLAVTKKYMSLLNFNIRPDIEPKRLYEIAIYQLEFQREHLRHLLNSQQRQWELFCAHSTLMLEFNHHQSIVFLYNLVSTKNATPCVGPEILEINFYLENDISLGQYIEHVSHNAANACSEGCGLQLMDHFRSYVHDRGKLDVVVEPFACKIPGLQNTLLMWSYCKICRTNTPVVLMSDQAWKYSFGKYLELSFYSKKTSVIGSCTHDFYKDHIRYFGLNDLAVRIEYSTVDTLDLVVPKFTMHWNPEFDINLKHDTLQHTLTRARAFFNSVQERLDRVKVDSMTIDKMQEGQKKILQLKEKLLQQSTKIENEAMELYNTTKVDEHLCLNGIVRKVQDLSVGWDSEFQSFEANYLPSEKDVSRITSYYLRKLFSDKEPEDSSEKPKKQEPDENPKESQQESDNEEIAVASEKEEEPKPIVIPDRASMVASNGSPTSFNVSSKPSVEKFLPQSAPEHRKWAGEEAGSSKMPIGTLELEAELKRGRSLSNKDTLSPREVPGDSPPGSSMPIGRVQRLANMFNELPFDEISMEFEKQREREKQKIKTHRAIPVISSNPRVAIYKNAIEALEDGLVNPSRRVPLVHSSSYEGKGLSTSSPNLSSKERPKAREDLLVKLDEEITPTEKVPLIKTLSNFWADRSAALWKPLAYPLKSSEHVFVDSDVLVREDEPSSLIAFCLSTSDYNDKLRSVKEARGVVPSSNDDGFSVHSSAKDGSILSNQVGGSADKANISKNGISELERIMLKKTAIHLKYQFQEGPSLLSCKIFFAEQFDAFRTQCGCDDKFVQSLSRCVKWVSTGGKSGSAFLKTLDDRFIIKQLTTSELDSFVNFAPSYFEYFSQALFHDLPTVLAKVFGFYTIQIKNTVTNKNLQMAVLIMENLFYGRKTSRIFDLKGSMRNRHVEQTGKENEVLLDENMVEYIYESPLFIDEHAKKLLRASLWNDTLFLAKMNVMDYSLVIGIDSDRHELVVGIIDCIRTFTWDKKLESWVKEKGLVGGGGGAPTKEPTVVTPKQYKNRFREAMERYILMVPDCWYQGT
ncbi:BA75_03590T0 [Komagataella pastoris]|uniref:1-phosphatidylinositol-3-phosphate 5-kinase n=1 Tax=Komagataella pastoris TaxID=4922 RepID=A0A1B2JFA0_PICPA|nr:BA75_03590T0 [Komagataella pastoris]